MLVELIHQQHIELRELFARHQEALLQGQLDDAKTWLAHFKSCQEAHMQIEEKYLFPAFAKIERQSRWDVSLYEREHAKINRLCETITGDLEWLSQQTLEDAVLRRNIIALLDQEKTLKGLNEHHEDREEDALLKELDARLDARLLKELHLDITLTWAEVMGAVKEAAKT